MGLVIGVDEAGYGPNLGPLVISATVWEVPGDPAEFDFWHALRRVLSSKPSRGARKTAAAGDRSVAGGAVVAKRRAERLHVGDSKQVYSPARGLGPLETSVLSLLGCHAPASIPRGAGSLPGSGTDDEAPTLAAWGHELVLKPAHASFGTLADLWRHLCAHCPAADCTEAWFGGDGLAVPLPLVADESHIAGFVERLQQQFEDADVRLRCVASDIVLTERFNGLIESLGGKGAALSRTTLELLRRVWEPARDGPALVVADKHGGRSHYQGLLANVFDALPMCLEEGLERSRYALGRSELRFEARAERHLPVAVASMVSKYVRELSMEAFNRFWRRHLPELQPTKGYPTDARRFRREIAAVQARLGIADRVLWRER